MRAKEFISEDKDITSNEVFNGVIKQIKYINARFIIPSEKEFWTQRQNLKWWLNVNPGKTKEDWAKYWLEKSKPIPVQWMGNTWDMHIYDGHHRLMAYKILGLMPRVIVTASQVPVKYIENLLREDDGSLRKGGVDRE
jgi:hypothetical protein